MRIIFQTDLTHNRINKQVTNSDNTYPGIIQVYKSERKSRKYAYPIRKRYLTVSQK